ncbi:hypothetical protein EJ02DRAFT_257634 [Clathrospora elynae]|uniref:Uncharacterized protein n=1 Tax=Clathrospora elynae TaxID=706981 RepID=A0A6A5SIG0_9PLEO|nr:hypothetical protein EJ02DRAFT_257634 [Clathrospora elynae]
MLSIFNAARLDSELCALHQQPLTMSTTAGRSRNALSGHHFFSRLLAGNTACHFPHSYRCLSSIWNAVRPRLAYLHCRHTPEPLSMVSMGRLYVGPCASVVKHQGCA